MADGKARPEHIQKAYDELVNEIKESIQKKELEYERLEVERIKYEMYAELQFSMTHNITRDEKFLSETYSKEEKIQKELKILQNQLSTCERYIKEDWIK